MSIIATTGSNALRAGTTGLQIVRYWTYTKYPLGESWEANFPTIIYLVGCNPPFSVALYCTGAPTQKVLYHSNNICSITTPGGDYVISWDRKNYCPPDLGAICEEGEEPPGGEIVVEKATVDLCLTVSGDTIQFPMWYGWWEPVGEYIYQLVGCVEPNWFRHMVGGEIVCTQRGVNAYCVFPCTSGAMTGNSTTGWTRGPIHISPAGIVSLGGTAECFGNSVSYVGAGNDIALDDAWNCPIGSSSIPVVAVDWVDYFNESGLCCPEGTQCDDHEYICDAGTIEIITTIKIGGSC